ncbi:hypothetical protein [Psychrobacter sp. JCM 18900]|nr:hypothetical protein [Psychrobacter sp. JCM 18900]
MIDPRGRDAYWLSLRKGKNERPSETSIDAVQANQDMMTDYQAVAAGYVSLSPVRLHHTPTEALDRLSTLAL